jgi:hypothetical protein
VSFSVCPGIWVPAVEGVYDRHDYSDEKAEALTRLAALVEKIINPPPANVADIEQARASRKAVPAHPISRIHLIPGNTAMALD